MGNIHYNAEHTMQPVPYQVSEVFRNHQLQSLRCAGGIACDHGVSRHYLVNGCSMRIKAFRGDLGSFV
jgi:hypothetical protein